MTNVQCYSCKGFRIIVTNCTAKLCNYKKTKHNIINCSIRPPKKFETAYNASIGPLNDPCLGQSSITPDMVQQMIVYALSPLGFLGNKNSNRKPWYFDYGAFNHMTNIVLPLNNVKKI